MIKQFATLLVITFFSSAAISADLMFQSGNIIEGKTWDINGTSGVASYYAEGNSGMVQFYCVLKGDKDPNAEPVMAFLTTGKNFSNQYNMLLTVLDEGVNGPFTWRLTDNDNGITTVGNIKVHYRSGSHVTIQCYGQHL